MRVPAPRQMDRREALRGIGLLAGGAALAGCAAAQVETGPGRADAVYDLVPVKAREDRIIRTVVGLRPYRPAGFVVRTDVIDGKPIVHNYGHGGGGITLSWGTAHLAMEEAMRTEHRRCAVIGCGAVGLATARLLQRHGWDVTIYARDLPPRTTSNIAGGQWSPSSVFESGSVDSLFHDRFARAARLAHRYYQDLVSPYYGVRWIDQWYTSDREIDARLHGGLADLFPNGDAFGPGEHAFPSRHAYRETTMLVEPHIYLAAMERDVRLAGAQIVVREFRSPAELVALPEPLVVNCTGLGARELFDDRELIPVRGQLVILLPQPEVDYLLLTDAFYYMFPRADGIVLGGTFERNEWSLEPDPATTTRIVGAHSTFFAAMTRPAGA